jgi:hypothetical protein
MPILHRMPCRWLEPLALATATFSALLPAGVPAAAAEHAATAARLVARYCHDCHKGDATEADVDLADFSTPGDLERRTKLWQQVGRVLAEGDMPPQDSDQPSADERRQLLDFVQAALAAEARKRAGDPGRVVLRRLSNAEYTFTIRDLTGVATLDPAREFPVDGAAGEGFTNTGQALVMSPALVTKYLDAAKGIAAHAVLLPDGLRFSDSNERGDQVGEALGRLRAFFSRFTVARDDTPAVVGQGIQLDAGHEGFLPIDRYLLALSEARDATRADEARLSALARDRSLSEKYLRTLWRMLESDEAGESLLLDRLRAMWRAGADPATLAAEVRTWQDRLWKFNKVGFAARHVGRTGGPTAWLEPVTPLANAQELRIPLPPGRGRRLVLQAGDAGDGATDDVVAWEIPRLADAARAGDLVMRPPAMREIPLPDDLGGELVLTARIPPEAGPEATVQVHAAIVTGDEQPTGIDGLAPARPFLARRDTAGWGRLTRSFADHQGLLPPAVCYGRVVPVDEVVTFNLYYREDERLRTLLLDEAEAATLNRLWDELLWVSREPLEIVDVYEQMMEFITQEAEFRVLRESFEPVQAVLAARADAFRSRLQAAEPAQVEAVIDFAARAFRRPLADAEGDRLRALYATFRGEGLDHEAAVRLLLARVLVAPEFLYKIETPGPGREAAPVTGHELACRLSYFLWSSLPDAELLREAAAGRLHEPAVLRAQLGRMVADPKIRRLAEQFGTHWLHVENFDEHDEKSPTAFPEFAGLREAMHEEAVLLLVDLFQRDRPIRSLLDADHTFLNDQLAAFYGIPGVEGPQWRLVEGVRAHGRGGVLTLAAALAKQAGASRTSPILRGTWITEVLLGQRVPKPPQGVPPLAEAPPQGLSERELTALHSRDAACAGCHARFDPYGFALEAFDAIGRRRERDVTGQPVDTTATLPDGAAVAGHADLARHLAAARGDAFVRQFCKKLLGYALGRETQLSDLPLLDAIDARLESADGRVMAAVEAIATSPQFLRIRGAEADDHE